MIIIVMIRSGTGQQSAAHAAACKGRAAAGPDARWNLSVGSELRLVWCPGKHM